MALRIRSTRPSIATLRAIAWAVVLVGATPALALRVTLDPTDAVNPVRTSHTVTATLLDGSTPVAGVQLGFEIVSGPNAGASGSCDPVDCITDQDGQVRFTWTDTAGPGVDRIRAFVDDNDNGVCDDHEPQVICRKTWVAGTVTTTTAPKTTTTKATTSTTVAKTTTTMATTFTTTTAAKTTTTKATTTTTTTKATTTTLAATTSTSTTSTTAQSVPIETTTSSTAPTTSTTMPPAPVVQCYEIKPFRFARIPGIRIVDPFNDFTTALRQPHKVCLRADGGGPVAGDIPALTAYPTEADVTGPSGVTVQDAFNTLRLDVRRPDFALVGSLMRIGGVPAGPAPDAPGYECYRVRPARGGSGFQRVRNVPVDDVFGAILTDLLEPHRLCAPASVDGVAPAGGYLMCYRSRSATNFGTVPVGLLDVFGTLDVRLIRRQEVCAPATVTLP